MLDSGGGGGSGGFSSDGLIDPSLFAAQSSDMYPSQIEESATRLRAMGKSVHTQVGDIDSSWGGLKSHYEAPEQQRVYDLMDPAVKSARELKSTLSKAAGHLDLYASELHCLKPRLKDLERRAEKFRAEVIGGVTEDPFAYGYSNDISIEKKIIPWDEDPESRRKNENLLKEYGGLHEEISTAATKCANSINDLVESWSPGDREAVTAEAVTNPEQPMPWGTPVEADLGWVGDLGQGVLNVPVDAAKDMSPLVLGYNPDSGEDMKWGDLNNWGVRWEAVKGTADFYGSTAAVVAAGWTQGGARLFGKEEPAWTRTKDMQEKYDRALSGWGSVIKYDHQAAKAGGDGWHEYKGEGKVETWSEMGTTVLLTLGTGGAAAAAKGGTKSIGAGRAATGGVDAPVPKAPKSLLGKGTGALNPLRGLGGAIAGMGRAYPSGHGPGRATSDLLARVDDGPRRSTPEGPVSDSINKEPAADAPRGADKPSESGRTPASGAPEPRRTVSQSEAPAPWGPEDVAAARERSGGVDHRTGEPLRAEGPNGQRQWHMKWDPEAREWVAENPGAGHTDPAGSKAAGRSSIGSFAIPDDAVRIKSGGKGGWEHQLYAPEPNKTYLVDDKFAYVTDDQGRVKEAHGVLEDAPRDAAGHRQTKAGGVDRLPGDEGGHIFGKSLGGPGEDVNLLAMSRDANRSQYAKLETEWRHLLKGDPPPKIEATVRPVYQGDSQRPSRMLVEWTKDGAKQKPLWINN